MCMDLIILETCYPFICESDLKVTNGFKCWKGEQWGKCGTKGKNTLHLFTEAFMWLCKFIFLKISGVEGIDNEKRKPAEVWKGKWVERACGQVDVLWSYKDVFMWALQRKSRFWRRITRETVKTVKKVPQRGKCVLEISWKWLWEVTQWDAEINATAGSGATCGLSPRQFFSSCLTLKAPNWTVHMLKIAIFFSGNFLLWSCMMYFRPEGPRDCEKCGFERSVEIERW